MDAPTTSPVQDLLSHIVAFCDDCLNREDYTAAWQALCRAVSLAPNRADVLCHRGRLAFFLRDTETAQRDFTEALKVDPRCSAAWAGMARYHCLRGEPARAEAAADRALGIDSADEDAAQVKVELQTERCNTPLRGLSSMNSRAATAQREGCVPNAAGAHAPGSAGQQGTTETKLPSSSVCLHSSGVSLATPSLSIRVVETIEEFKRHFGLHHDGVLLETDLDVVATDCDLNGRKRRDAEVLCTLAANATGDVLELGTSHGRGAFKLASNLAPGLNCHTVNILPEQHDASGGKMVTHLIPKVDIGSYYRERGIRNVEQHFANTARWEMPAAIQNLSLAFIDAAHDEENVYLDSKLAWDRLAPGGFMVWHDFSKFSRHFDWVDASMRGAERFVAEMSFAAEIIHLRHSWMGVLRKPAASTKLRVGFVLEREFHDQNRWTSITTPCLINGILNRFEIRWIQNQADYEAQLGDVEVLLSLEAGWGAPTLDLTRTPALREKLKSIPSYMFYSDPHGKRWREDYVLNGLDFVLAFYDAPTRHHFRRLPVECLVHFPWAIPDSWIGRGPLTCGGAPQLTVFGASEHEAYDLRNWCRTFPFVESFVNSGCENKAMTDEGYFNWLASRDAVIAAGSDDPRYRLTTPKYFEIATVGALLFAQETDDLEKLGFRHRDNCIVFNRSNFETLARAYLRAPREYLQIRSRGRELIRRRHALSVRLAFLEDHMRENIEKKSEAMCTLGGSVHRAAGPAGSKDYSVLTPSSLGTDFAPRVVERTGGEITVSLGRLQFHLHPGRYLDHELVGGSLFEAASIRILDQLIRPGQTVVDVGANFGYYTLLLSRWVGSAGQVIAFEPTREYGLRNQAHIRDNRLDNVRFEPCGLSDHDHTADIQIGECSGTMHWTAPSSPRGTETIRLIRFDDWWSGYVAEGNPDRLDFLKIDVDGHELHVVRGALKTLRCHRPILLIEFYKPNFEQAGYTCADLADFLERELGYTLCDEQTGKPFDSRATFLTAVNRPDLSVNVFCIPALESTQSDTAPQAKIFTSPAELYLASADRMDRVLTNLNRVRRELAPAVDTYATVIGGLSGLNYLTALTPKRIIFYDINPIALDYARLIVELIRLTTSPQDFISRVFSRAVIDFLSETGESDLTVGNQEHYLSRPVDETLLADTLARLSSEGRKTFLAFMQPYLAGRTLEGVRNCRRLLPCWPANQRVPVGGGAALGCDEAGQLVPNTNTFFLGLGWLESLAVFALVRKVMDQATLSFEQFDLLHRELLELVGLSDSVVLHVSNIDDWFPSEWPHLVQQWQMQALAAQCRLTIVSSHSGLTVMPTDPHAWAFRALVPHVSGRVVEVTHKVPWGFHEFARLNVTVQDYLAGDFPADTTILHILLGEGVVQPEFLAVYRKAAAGSRRVIVLEHNRDSVDWGPRPSAHFVTEPELRTLLLNEHLPVRITQFQNLIGVKDDRRNLLVVLESETPSVNPAMAVPLGTTEAAEVAHTTSVPQQIPKPLSGSQAKPRVLLIADVPNWIFARHCRMLERFLGDRFVFTSQCQGTPVAEEGFDLIYPLEWNLVPPQQIRTPAKYVTGIRSHLSWRSQDFLPFVDILATHFQRVHVVSKRLQGMFARFLPEVSHLTHGVDTEFFAPRTRANQSGQGKVRIGWAGNRINRTKGFEDYVAPLGSLPGVELVFCGFQDRNLNVELMRDFYDSLDVYICASSLHHEGNNNSLLEAAAMQRAIITTDNGAVPEYLRNGESAIIVERELPNFIRAVIELRDNPAKRMALGEQARLAVKQRFEWRNMAEQYAALFEDALSHRHSWHPDLQASQRAVAQTAAVSAPAPAEDPAAAALQVLLARAVAGAAEGHKVLAELLLEEVLEKFPGNAVALELQRDLQTAAIITKRFVPAAPKAAAKFRESKLAHEFLDGLKGLEIGGSAHNPFGLNTRNVDYCADLTTVFKLEEVRMCGEALKVDVVAPGDELPLPDESEDFVISSHVIEHFFDPIKAIKEWLRVVRPGGYVFIVAPHKERTFDKDRSRTPLQELLDRHSGKIPRPAVDTHEHYSVWITEDLLEVSSHFKWNVVACQDADDKVGNGFTLLIQKAPKPPAPKPNPDGGLAGKHFELSENHLGMSGITSAMPLVSVIVPTHNRPDRLVEAVQSILNQSFKNFEIIVVNDAGCDVDATIAPLNTGRQVVCLRHETNRGLAAARNTGLQAARGRYIAYLDDDDLFYPDHLQTLVDFLEAHPGSVAYTDANRAHQEQVNGHWQTTKREVAYSQEWDADSILVDNFVPVLCFMHERAGLQKSGLFDETLARHEDWDLWIRLSRHFPFAHIPKVTCEFSLRDDASSMTGQSLSRFVETMQHIHAKYAAYTSGRPDLLAAQRVKRDELQELAQATPKFKAGFLTLDSKVTACAYLRLTAPLNYLHGRRQLEHLAVCELVSGTPTPDLEKLRQVQLLVVQRGMVAGVPYQVLRAAFPSSARIVFELDDALTLLPPSHGAFNHFQSLRPQLEDYLRNADLVTVTTPKLRELYSGFNEHIEVLPNAVDTEIWKPRSQRPPSDGKVRILFSGTLTHQHDLALVAPAIERIALEIPEQVEFLFWGNTPARLHHLPQIRTAAEFTDDYRSYSRCLQALPIDLALVPLEITAFNRAKSEIKWLEYSACHIPAIFTAIEAYNQTVEHGITGWLIPNTVDAWYGAMKRLIEDGALRIRIGEAAHEAVMSRHTLKQLAPLWVQAYARALARPARKPGKREPQISIVIPTFNNLSLTRQCLDSILGNTPQGLFEILVVDNGSTDGTVAFLNETQMHGRLRFISNSINLGFAHACNQGAATARSKYVLFLNNDTSVTSGWANALLEAGQRPGVGVVGAKLLYPDGTVQHAGIGWINGVPDHPHRHSDSAAPEVNIPRDLDMVTGACFFMPRALFLQLGGFDETYRNGVEDVDLCLRVRAAGYRVLYEPKAVVSHYEGKTQGRFDHVTENLKIFFARWQGQFDENHTFKVPNEPRLQKSENSFLLAPVRVCWHGSFLDHGSLSHVNRALTDALEKQSQVTVTRIGNSTPSVSMESNSEFTALARRLCTQAPPGTSILVRHQWPPDWSRPKQGALVIMQPWEFGILPKDWVQQASGVDEFWANSNYVRQVYVASGVDAAKVKVVPLGIDPTVFRPDAPPRTLATTKRFKFLFVGGTIHRKGPDVLLAAYLKIFTAADDVCLVIKDFGGKSVYAGQTLEGHIQAAQATPNSPEILYLNEELPSDALPGLYTACDSLVHPYRGEGFGLPILEAMACGLPAIVTAGGSADDFATDEFAYRIPAGKQSIGDSISGLKLAGPGWLLEPDAIALGKRMKWVVNHCGEARAKGFAASEYVRREWTWERAASVAEVRLRELIARQAASSARSKEQRVRQAAPITLPPCALLGHLGEARQFFNNKKLPAAWGAVRAALKHRTFHPEAYLLMAEIALAAHDAVAARACAQFARQIAPDFRPAKKFLKASLHGNLKPDWLVLPDTVRDAHVVRHPHLSVCLIVKNEERFLGKCLESVEGLADQIVVVDTGSTDRTVEIAKQHKAEVHSFAWCDDFSAARNAALEYVTGDWVLMLDADEELPMSQHEALRKLLRAAPVISWRLPLQDVGREAEGCSYVPRLFRNAPGLFYVGRVHEQVFTSLEVRRQEWGLETRMGDATLRHYGYTKELTQERDKVGRNLRLLEKAVLETPGEANLLMNYGLELTRSGRSEEGLRQYRAAYEALADEPPALVVPESREMLLSQFCTQLMAAKRHAEIVQVLTSPVAKLGVGLTASLHFALGLAQMELKDFATAAEQFRQCLAKRDRPALTPVNVEIRKAGPRHCLALCLAQTNGKEAAEREFQAAREDDSESVPVVSDYARFLQEQGRAIEALQLLHPFTAERPQAVAAWLSGGAIALSQMEFLEVAVDWTAEALRHFPEDVGIQSQRAEALLLAGQPAEALPLWRKLAIGGKPSSLGALILCEAAVGKCDSAPPPELAGAVTQEFVRWYRRLLEVGAEPTVLRVNAGVAGLGRVLPRAAELLRAVIAEAGTPTEG